MIRVISPIRAIQIVYLRAVLTFGLVVRSVVIGSSILVLVSAVLTFGLVGWGIVIGSSALVLVRAVATFSSIGWGKYSHGEGGLVG